MFFTILLTTILGKTKTLTRKRQNKGILNRKEEDVCVYTCIYKYIAYDEHDYRAKGLAYIKREREKRAGGWAGGRAGGREGENEKEKERTRSDLMSWSLFVFLFLFRGRI